MAQPGPGYIYVVNWERYQHYRDREPRWIKMYRDLLHKDEYLRLSLADRGLLHDLWKLASVSGDGRVSADRTLLARQLNVRRVSLEPLIQAGFIRIRASKALATRYQDASPEGSKEPKRKKRARTASSRAAAARVPEDRNGHEPARDDELNRAAVVALHNIVKPMEGRP